MVHRFFKENDLNSLASWITKRDVSVSTSDTTQKLLATLTLKYSPVSCYEEEKWYEEM
jgi:hypothetical protein